MSYQSCLTITSRPLVLREVVMYLSTEILPPEPKEEMLKVTKCFYLYCPAVPPIDLCTRQVSMFFVCVCPQALCVLVWWD